MDKASDRGFVVRVLVKALLLFAAANVVFAALVPAGASAALGRFSLYNSVFPGRARFPFGENPEESYNLSLYNLDAMFASHEIGREKARGEMRVVLIGDSSVWGTLLDPEQTLAGQINALELACGEKRVTAYNLGYPTISLVKDVMILRRVLRPAQHGGLAYQPDLIVWPTTLEAFPPEKQLASPLAANNAAEIAAWYPVEPSAAGLLENSIVGQRRALADLARLQAYGVMWAATGIDQAIPARYQPAAVDLDADASYYDWSPDASLVDQLAFDVLAQGIQVAQAAGVPVLLVNEPMLISQGANSDIRYNFFYPRWAYDAWRAELTARAAREGWPLLDTWDLLPPQEFTNSAIHLTPAGEKALAERVGAEIVKMCGD